MTAAAPRMPRTRALAHAEFFGGVERRVEAPGLVLSLMAPDAEREVELHTHATAHFIVHLSGRYLSSAAGAPPECAAPAVVYNPPGTTHRDRYARQGGRVAGRFLSVAVSGALWVEAMDVDARGADATMRADGATLARGARLVRLACGAFEDASVLEAEALVLELLGGERRVEPPSAAAPPWLARAVECLRERSAGPVTVREVAALCDVHPVHLARVCRQHLGVSPAAVMRSARLERAAALLARSSESVSGVAARCGFADHGHLTHTFRRAHGLTPSAYRAALR